MKRKSFVLFAAIIISMLIGLAGCGAIRDGAPAPAAPEVVVSEWDVPDNITIWHTTQQLPPWADTWGCLPYWQEVERRLGTNIEFYMVPGGPGWGEANTQIHLMIAANTYPELVVWAWGGMNRVQLLDEGTLIDLSQFVRDGTMPALANLLNNNPDVRRQMAADDDGRIANLGNISLDEEMRMIRGWAVRQDWLDNLGLDIPTNTDEFYDVLQAFRTGDPTGTGREVIPLGAIGWNGLGWTDAGLHYISGAFGINGQSVHEGKFVVNGQLRIGMLEPEFTEVLAFSRMLFEHGLIDPDFGNMVPDERNVKIQNSEIGMFPANFWELTDIIRHTSENDPTARFSGIPHLRNSFDGSNYFFDWRSVALIGGTPIAMTGNAQDPEGLARFLDFFYTEEGMVLGNYGIEGWSFFVNDRGERVLYTVELFDLLPAGATRDAGQLQTYFYPATIPPVSPVVGMGSAWMQKMGIPESRAIVNEFQVADKSRTVNSNLINSLRNTEEFERTAEIMEAIAAGTAIGGLTTDEIINQIITGEEPLSVWDNVLADMRRAGIDEYLQIMQGVFDRFMAR